MKISCIIVEDEPLAAERIKNYVLKIEYLDIVAIFNNGTDAMVFLQSNNIDLIFLDINIGDISGIQLLESSHTKAEVIVTTAYETYALKGFDLHVTDYLLKPYGFDRFMEAVGRVKNNLALKEPSADKKFIFIKTEYRLEKVVFNDLLYIEGMRDYRKVHTTSRKIMTLQTFKEFEKEVAINILCRVHKSYMVAIDKIDSVERDGINIRGVTIPVSDTYRKAFLEVITHSNK